MKNTKENVIKLIKADIETLRSLETYYREKNDYEWAGKYQRERWGLERTLNLLTDNEYFNAMWKVMVEKNAD